MVDGRSKARARPSPSEAAVEAVVGMPDAGREGGRGDSCGGLLTKAHVPFRPDKITNMLPPPPLGSRMAKGDMRGTLKPNCAKKLDKCLT